jgi:hypothetical protein
MLWAGDLAGPDGDYRAWPGYHDPVSKRRVQCASGSTACRVRSALRKKDADCPAAALATSRP